MAEKDLLPQLAAYLIAESDAESQRTPSETSAALLAMLTRTASVKGDELA